MSKTKKIVSISLAVLFAVIMVAIYDLVLPAWNIRSSGLWCFITVALVIAAVIVTCICVGEDYEKPIKISWTTVVVILVLYALLGIISSPMFHAHKLHDVAQVTVSDAGVSDFDDLSVVENMETVPLIDLDSAISLGDKGLASIPHPEWYEVDHEYNLIQYQGEYYRLSTIDYGGFYKYNKAKYDAIPGYILVSVTPENGVVTQEASVVILSDPIRYTPGAYGSYDLRRHLHYQYPSYMLDRAFMEIDENGTPYWVTGVLRPSTGLFGGGIVNSFILTNAQTGESQEYPVSDAPSWIDHVYSLDYLMKVAYWHYGYADGFLNNYFSMTNVWRTSYAFRDRHRDDGDAEDSGAEQFANFFGYSSIVSQSGEVCFYTGLTAANKANSNLGWLVIDTSTGKMTQYDLVGAEESSAQSAIEELVQEKGYEATFPLPANIGGEASYVMCLKGKAGLVQGYGICNMENYSIAVQANTLDEAIRKYQAKLNGATDEVAEGAVTEDVPTTVGETKSGSGKITNIKTAEIGGTTQFYYVIDGQLYRSSITVDERQVLYKVGTEISFDYYEDGDIMVITAIK